MPAEKATALVLRVIDWSESSCVVSLYSREFGRIRGLAKGGRRLKGPFEAALDLLSTVRVVFLRKSTDALDLLYEAKLDRRFRPPGRDLARYYAGYYVAELLNELSDDYEPHPELYDAAQTALERLRGSLPISQCLMPFEFDALRILGHLPSLAECAECGTPVEAVGRVAFGLLLGGVLCPACRPGKKQVVSLSAPTVLAMRALTTPGVAVDRLPEIAGGTWGELRGVLNHYVSHLAGKRLQMQAYLGAVG